MHWLQTAAARAEIPGVDTLRLPRDVTLADGWDTAARAFRMTPVELAHRLAGTFRLAAANLETAEPPARPLIPEKLARKHHVFPLRQDDRALVVATADPTDYVAEQELSFATGKRIVFELAPYSAITEALNAAFSVEKAVESLLSKVDGVDAELVRIVEEELPEEVTQRDVEAAPIVKLTSIMLSEAVQQRASDIHVEPGAGAGRNGIVRFRVDGVLRQYLELPAAAVVRIVSRIKVLAKLDIADRMRPQDGRARIQVGEKSYDLRISTVPTHDGEKAVVRILRPDTLRTLGEMQLSTPEMLRLQQLLSYRDGLVTVTGPTGSGKTTTLYAALRQIANGEVNVMTVEDPVEYELSGVTQIQVDVKKGMTFASALRSILRQDPDVILVGEIRDAETAKIAAQAALTGHLVLGTLHTNDAMSAVTRLAELGLDRATIAAILRGSIAQRLIRRVCTDCAERITDSYFLDEQQLAEAYGAEPVVRSRGCRTCGGTGFFGRLPVVEVAVVTPGIADLINNGASAAALQRASIDQGMFPMRSVAREFVDAGQSTIEEVDRVLGESTITDESGRNRVSRPVMIPRFVDADGQTMPMVDRRQGDRRARRGRRATD